MSSVAHSTFTLERTYSAPPARVYAAWSEPGAKAEWFGDPGEIGTREEYSLDFRVGGREHFVAELKDGTSVRYDGVYQDLVPDQRILTSYEMHFGPRRISVSLLTIELAGVPGGTRLVLTEQDAFLDGLDTREERQGGTEVMLDQLAGFLAERDSS